MVLETYCVVDEDSYFPDVIIATGIRDVLGTFTFSSEVYDLETLMLMYYLGSIIPIIILLTIGIGSGIFDFIKKRNNAA